MRDLAIVGGGFAGLWGAITAARMLDEAGVAGGDGPWPMARIPR